MHGDALVDVPLFVFALAAEGEGVDVSLWRVAQGADVPVEFAVRGLEDVAVAVAATLPLIRVEIGGAEFGVVLPVIDADLAVSMYFMDCVSVYLASWWVS